MLLTLVNHKNGDRALRDISVYLEYALMLFQAQTPNRLFKYSRGLEPCVDADRVTITNTRTHAVHLGEI